MALLTILANCQAGPMAALISQFCPDLNVIRSPLVHQITDKNRLEVIQNIQKSDIVIHQPLGPSFKELSTAELKSKFPSKTFVSFPSIFFGGLFPQLSYLRLPEGGTMKGPLSDYHDTRIIDCFLNRESSEVCLGRMKSEDPLELKYYDISLKESLGRDRAVDIPVMEIILDEMSKSPPLFTFNHPTNRVLWRVLERILKLLGLQAPQALDLLPEREFLGNTRAMIPDSIPKSLGLDWRQPKYSIWEDELPLRELITSFYQLYNEIPNFPAICRDNEQRFNLPVRLGHYS